MMRVSSAAAVGIFVLSLALLAGCGGGGGTGSSSDPELPAPTATNFTPGTLPSEVGTAFVVTGTDFRPVGGSVKVRLSAGTGTPFFGETSAYADLVGTVESSTRITGTSWPCGVCGTSEATVTVILGDGKEGTSTGTLTTVVGPTLTGVSPAPMLSLVPHEFEVFGTGLGGPAKVRFTAAEGTPFQDGTSATLEVAVTATSPTRLVGKTPFRAATSVTWADVTLVCDSGAEASLGSPDFCALTKHTASTPHSSTPGWQFGSSVAISGNTAFVGAPQYGGTSEPGPGAAYVLERHASDTWVQTQELMASDRAEPFGNRFGISVAIDGNLAVVGADDPHGATFGAAYVFVRQGGGWSEQQKLTRNGGAAGAHFGCSVAVCEATNTIVVGAYADTPVSASVASGSVFVYEWNGISWVEKRKLVAADGVSGDLFGYAVALSGNNLIVGAPGGDDFGTESGSAYAFHGAGSDWTELPKLTGDGGVAAMAGFGYAVAIDGGMAVVGAPYDDPLGVAYVFTGGPSGWYVQAELTNFDGAWGDRFGWSLALAGDLVLVGAPGNWSVPELGSAFLFVGDGMTWGDAREYAPEAGSEGSLFGATVALSSDAVLIGAYEDDDQGEDAGAVYAADLPPARCTPQRKLTASDGAAGDYFGGSVAISGDTVVVGARGDDDKGSYSGSAHVFTRSGTAWTLDQKLLALDGASGDDFGHSVAISGDTVVVGAYGGDGNATGSGAAYVFTRSGSIWSERKLAASDGASGDRFGWSVAISGGTMVVGAFGDDDNGSAYVFVRNSAGAWVQQTKLTASDGAAGLWFGYSVAISGDTAVVGALFGDGNATRSGAAYVFTRSGSTWSEAKLAASDGAGEACFGSSVGVSGDMVAVGAWDDGYAVDAVYVFTRNGTLWDEDKLVGTDPAKDSGFGHSVAVSDDTVLVGAPIENPKGAVHRFTRSGSAWTRERLEALDGASGDWFGSCVAVSGDTVVVGAADDDDKGTSSGSVYIH